MAEETTLESAIEAAIYGAVAETSALVEAIKEVRRDIRSASNDETASFGALGAFKAFFTQVFDSDDDLRGSYLLQRSPALRKAIELQLDGLKLLLDAEKRPTVKAAKVHAYMRMEGLRAAIASIDRLYDEQTVLQSTTTAPEVRFHFVPSSPGQPVKIESLQTTLTMHTESADSEWPT